MSAPPHAARGVLLVLVMSLGSLPATVTASHDGDPVSCQFEHPASNAPAVHLVEDVGPAVTLEPVEPGRSLQTHRATVPEARMVIGIHATGPVVWTLTSGDPATSGEPIASGDARPGDPGVAVTEPLTSEAVCLEVYNAGGEPVRVAYELAGLCIASDGTSCTVAP